MTSFFHPRALSRFSRPLFLFSSWNPARPRAHFSFSSRFRTAETYARKRAHTQSLSAPSVPFLPISDILTSYVDCFARWFYRFSPAERSASLSFPISLTLFFALCVFYFYLSTCSFSFILPLSLPPPFSLSFFPSVPMLLCIHSNARNAFSLHASHHESYPTAAPDSRIAKLGYSITFYAIFTVFTLSHHLHSPSSRYLSHLPVSFDASRTVVRNFFSTISLLRPYKSLLNKIFRLNPTYLQSIISP